MAPSEEPPESDPSSGGSSALDLVLVRHGLALERDLAEEQGIGERDRPLTEEGRSRMKRAAQGIARYVPEGAALWTSPLLRAVETAEILGRALGGEGHRKTDALLPEAEPAELLESLKAEARGSAVVAVGHEPHLGRFVAFSLDVPEPPPFDLRKGGACLLRFEADLLPGKGKLLWLVTSKMFRRLGR